MELKRAPTETEQFPRPQGERKLCMLHTLGEGLPASHFTLVCFNPT